MKGTRSPAICGSAWMRRSQGTDIEILRVKNNRMLETGHERDRPRRKRSTIWTSRTFSSAAWRRRNPEEQRPALLSAYREIIVSLNEQDPMARIGERGMRILGVRFKNLNSLVGRMAGRFHPPGLCLRRHLCHHRPHRGGKDDHPGRRLSRPLRQHAPPGQGHEKQQRDHVAPDRRMLRRGDLRDPEGSLPLPLEPAPRPEKAGRRVAAGQA